MTTTTATPKKLTPTQQKILDTLAADPNACILLPCLGSIYRLGSSRINDKTLGAIRPFIGPTGMGKWQLLDHPDVIAERKRRKAEEARCERGQRDRAIAREAERNSRIDRILAAGTDRDAIRAILDEAGE